MRTRSRHMAWACITVHYHSRVTQYVSVSVGRAAIRPQESTWAASSCAFALEIPHRTVAVDAALDGPAASQASD